MGIKLIAQHQRLMSVHEDRTLSPQINHSSVNKPLLARNELLNKRVREERPSEDISFYAIDDGEELLGCSLQNIQIDPY